MPLATFRQRHRRGSFGCRRVSGGALRTCHWLPSVSATGADRLAVAVLVAARFALATGYLPSAPDALVNRALDGLPITVPILLTILTARHVIRGTVEIATPKFPIRRTAHMVNVVGNEVGTTRVSGWVIRSTLTDSARLNI